MKKEKRKKVTGVYAILNTILHKLYNAIESLYELLRCQKDYITITNQLHKSFMNQANSTNGHLNIYKLH